MSDIAIRIENLSKMYRLGVINSGTLWRDLQSWIAIKRGQEDPNSKINEDTYKNNQDYFWALKDIYLDIQQGDRVGIIGKNGAGKSTLLKILSRITTPTKGMAKVKGKIASLLEVGTGFHNELTGRENIYLNGAILGMKKRHINEKMNEIIEFSGIERHIDTPVKRYSSGMFVRLAFAVAAYLDSDILIADEVLAVGDAEFQKKALGKMQDLSTGEGRTVLFVSHNMGAVKKLCNCGVVLENGNVKSSSKDILQLTTEYVNNFSENVKSLKWENTGEYNDPFFTPLSMELLEEDSSEITSEISADKNYMIKLTFEIREALPNLDFKLLFFTIDNDLLYFSSPFDYIKDYRPIIGINTLFCKIPKHLHNVREYIVSLESSIYCEKFIIDAGKYNVAIKFNVILKNRISPFGNLHTLLSPVMEWRNVDIKQQ